ncbi:ubiquinone biosynthesis accessory factor UbiJ [endosymbiont of Ridgeia piscesae]|jgi:ubiquinone biosynthesis protein UbiJ|uniref:Ubiquinone biosynthesis accessory factor UbiJ n=1 Tax=endosymbiont of Ridgeia piscesae TaxID=54398 RepID=A0A0T5YUJ5_9GAMM|nr:SCP2 sterol-binding domain-containing protein [endosymbiont of Ridgeia piscesae]KRT53966.1 Ubiquinone biosynthesis protein UbiJ [endosymbiont of Ridgeia piscesae]KRT58373.1 ubiquinone biosynthesis protein UbiJ [endosymbiont of Ridgeia piscesae]
MTVSAATFALLEGVINQAIRLDPETPKRLAPMHGKVIRFELLGLGISLWLIPEPQGIQLLSEFEGEPDCVLRGTPLDLARMRGSRQSAEQLFQGAVQIEGDSALAHRFGDFIAELDIDWEEQLSHLTGDLIAHEVGNLTRGLFSWARQSGKTARLNTQEYLQEELRLLPSRYEVDALLADIDTLRDDTERASARIERLRSQLAGSNQ